MLAISPGLKEVRSRGGWKDQLKIFRIFLYPILI